MLPALDGPARLALVDRLAGAPPAVLATVLGIAERVLAPADFAELKAAAAVSPDQPFRGHIIVDI